MKTFTLINNICHERKRRNEITFDSYLFLNIDIFIFEYGNIYIYTFSICNYNTGNVWHLSIIIVYIYYNELITLSISFAILHFNEINNRIRLPRVLVIFKYLSSFIILCQKRLFWKSNDPWIAWNISIIFKKSHSIKSSSLDTSFLPRLNRLVSPFEMILIAEYSQIF